MNKERAMEMTSDRKQGIAMTKDMTGTRKEWLAARLELLNEEVRNYPTPIARCDDQLTGLLEQRASAAAQLQRLSSRGDQGRSRADGIALAGELIDLLNRR